MTGFPMRAHFARLPALAVLAALAFAAPALAGGKVVSNAFLPLDGFVVAGDVEVDVVGRVHVVAQVWPGESCLVSLHLNLAGAEGIGDDGSRWVGVGANQLPPNPCVPPDPIHVGGFMLLPTGDGGAASEPFGLDLLLVLDPRTLRLDALNSEAMIAGR